VDTTRHYQRQAKLHSDIKIRFVATAPQPQSSDSCSIVLAQLKLASTDSFNKRRIVKKRLDQDGPLAVTLCLRQP
jgi:hypothetical protein